MLDRPCSGSKYCVNIQAEDQNGNMVRFQEIVGFANTGSYSESTRENSAISDVRRRMPYLKNVDSCGSFRI